MNLRLYKTLWGWPGTPRELPDAMRTGGFDGVEGTPRDGWNDALRELDFIGEVVTGGDYVPSGRSGVAEHLEDLRRGVDRCLEAQPRLINVIGGCDWWSFGEKLVFGAGVQAVESECGVPLALETHRSRMTYHPWVTMDLLRELPGLHFTCDFSHWCCVTERLVMDEEGLLLDELAKRCRHVHARVGFAQGPQVPDPRVAIHEEDLRAHLRWWGRLWDAADERGAGEFTMTPEFGPDGYLHTDPRDGQLVADLEEVNGWMAGRLREEFGGHIA